MKLTKFEKEELVYKLEVMQDNEEYLAEINKTEDDIAALIKKVESDADHFEQWELKELREEAENLLDIAEANYSAGFPEYYPDVRKLRKLNEKLELINA